MASCSHSLRNSVVMVRRYGRKAFQLLVTESRWIGRGRIRRPQQPALSDLLPSFRPHHLEVLEPPQTFHKPSEGGIAHI